MSTTSLSRLECVTPPASIADVNDQVGPFYTAVSVAKVIGVPEQEVVESAAADMIIGVQLEGGGWVFPEWQFKNFAVAAALVVLWKTLRAGGDRWTCVTWLRSPHPELDGRNAVDCVVAAVDDGADGQPLELVLELARADAQRWAQ
jgi:hypothetical protein